MTITPEELRATCAEAQATHNITIDEAVERLFNDFYVLAKEVSEARETKVVLRENWFTMRRVAACDVKEVIERLKKELDSEGFNCKATEETLVVSWGEPKRNKPRFTGFKFF